MNAPLSLYATAARGLPPLLADELRALGAEEVKPGNAGVAFSGSLETAYRVCLWSRLASRVLVTLARFEAPDADRLYASVATLPWEEHLAPEGTLAVDCTAVNAAIGHTRFAALKVKDALVDRFRDAFGVRPSVELETPDLRLNLHLRGTSARLALDLSGGSLHRRGYRLEGAAAPLKENLAAALLLLAGWPERAARGEPLLDPMCGSGTLLIEAALMAADTAPALTRAHFGFAGWLGHDEPLWERLREEAKARRQAGLERIPTLHGYDADAEAVAAARANATRAAVDEAVVIGRRALTDPLPRLPARGLLITNPPYGERIGDVAELRGTYADLGRILRTALPDWRAAIFTGNPELAGHVGLKPERSDTLFNGALECRLLHYPAAGERAAEVPAELTEGEGAVAFGNRLRKNLKHLTRWAKREGVDCFRVYDQDLPEYAVAVDLFQGDGRWAHVQEYQAPRSVDPDAALRRLQEVLAVVARELELEPEQVFLKRRERQKGRAQYQKQGETGRFHRVREGGLTFLVNFTDYLDTGLFLDHRITRARLREEAAGRRFLNLFCYTASASVYAAAGGALATTSVDLSHTYLEWAGRNLAENGFSGPSHQLVQADCRRWLADRARNPKGPRYDLIFLDPPTFSTSKRMQGTWDVQRDHVELVRDAVNLLAPGGVLYFSNNYRKFRLDREALVGLRIEDITARTLPEDFRRRGNAHVCFRIRV